MQCIDLIQNLNMLKYPVLFLLNIFFFEVESYVHLVLDPRHPGFDQSLYEDALDAVLCDEQLDYLQRNPLEALQFYDAGLRVPRGISGANFVDLGNYMQCLDIDVNTGAINIEGKYCTIDVPLNQNLQIPEFPSIPDWIPDIPDWVNFTDINNFDPTKLKVHDKTLAKLNRSKKFDTAVNGLNGVFETFRTRTVGESLEGFSFTLAVCLPKTCTVKEAVNRLYLNLSDIGFEFQENFCRLKDDKPWAPADYVAIVIFSLIGLITLISTCYDVWHTAILKTDSKDINKLGRCFSVYTNGRRLNTFVTNPNALECVDGIRSISMMWVILGHAFSTYPTRINVLDAFAWTISIDSTWVTAAPIAVDTFFMLSGMLLVYTTVGKLTGIKLLKSLHLFYLNRLLRMFPLLAAAVLVQASFLYRLADGPLWNQAALNTEVCREHWWSTLLYVQTYVNPGRTCLPHTWYLAIDMHMYIIAPIILYWVLSGKHTAAWISMTAAFTALMVASTIYIFLKEFPSAVIPTARMDEYMYYMVYYYMNTLTRGSPFLVGMIFGYILHMWRGEKLNMSKFMTLVLWLCSLALLLQGVFSSHPSKAMDWDNQTVDSLINAFSRPLWAFGIGLLIFACVKGYGGPINWLLSLQLWKLPSRLSYGMYLFHFPMMYITAGSILQPPFFSVSRGMFRFLSELLLALIVSYVATVLIDSPFSTLVKIVLGGGPKKPAVAKDNEVINGTARRFNENGTQEKISHHL